MRDWTAIKTEYITGDLSYRELAEKHGVSFSTMTKKATKEKWNEERQKSREEIVKKAKEQKENGEINRMERLMNVADQLLTKIEQSVSAIDVSNERAIKQIASAIKDIKDIQGCKTDRDIREQEARIRQLEKASEEQKQEPVKVVLTNQLEEWAE